MVSWDILLPTGVLSSTDKKLDADVLISDWRHVKHRITVTKCLGWQLSADLDKSLSS